MMSGYIQWLIEQNGTAPAAWSTPYKDAPKAKASSDRAFIALRGIHRGNMFCSHNSGEYRSDWYEEIGTFDTLAEAQAAIGVPEQHRSRD